MANKRCANQSVDCHLNPLQQEVVADDIPTDVRIVVDNEEEIVGDVQQDIIHQQKEEQQ